MRPTKQNIARSPGNNDLEDSPVHFSKKTLFLATEQNSIAADNLSVTLITKRHAAKGGGMRPIAISLEAELLVRQALAQSLMGSPGIQAHCRIDHIELFVDALNPNKVLFGTARVNDKKVPLSERLLKALTILKPRSTEQVMRTAVLLQAPSKRR